MTTSDPLVPTTASAVPPTPSTPLDLPYLPPAPPTVRRATVSNPVLPPTAVPPFGLVDASTHLPPVTSPTTSMPPAVVGTFAPAVGLDQARAVARKQQRRAALFGWGFAILAIGGASVGGYYGYHEWRDDQVVTTPAGTDGGPSAAGNTDRIIGGVEIDRVLDELDDQDGSANADGSLAPPTVPAGPSVPIALGVLGGPSRGGPEMITPGQDGAPPEAAGRSRGASVRVYSRGDHQTYVVNYDRLADATTVAAYDDVPAGAPRIVAYSGQWRYVVAADRTIERAARSAASLDPAADVAIADGVDVEQLVPASMRPFVDDGFVLLSGNENLFRATDGPEVVMKVDFAGFRAADPDAAAAWVARWSDPVPFDPTLAGGPTELNDGAVDEAVMDAWRRLLEPEGEALVTEGTAIAYSLGDDGRVAAAMVDSAENGFRVEYLDLGTSPFPILFDAADAGWS